MTAAIFLDKDGTLLADVPYNVDPGRMHFAPGALAGLACLGRSGLPLIVISNQAGIALGKFTAHDMAPMVRQMERMFLLAGAALRGFYYCPHHPQGTVPAYARECACRKPAPGLLRRAAQEHAIDLGASWFIGDILDDVEAGRRAGCNTLLIDNGNETEWRINEWRVPDRIERNLGDAGRWVARWLAVRRVSATAEAAKGRQHEYP
ncbi:D-glycero-alpha-D-manno-heptose-1,7-bisphosphate 7-phosphatase [Pollutimonas bauzanensis]|uniref:D,D-heptose 1,7-bisphosphate phosphatase n=1 Tax=Pollutimonas bauzanensis TaxID=658167 RepID=A0A1M5STU3_9BURK|nr:HAD family hydrolase [Pollutimonas bauzanensis]SHH41924.1 D,D-heptose 1,7-bisphosphate phosphatase [Pollutimonas bauzanensis]